MVLALASRRAAVAILLFVAASTAIFHQLRDQGLGNDEAHYAHIANGIRATGEWLHLRDVDGRPYLHKSPLHFWLSAATHGLRHCVMDSGVTFFALLALLLYWKLTDPPARGRWVGIGLCLAAMSLMKPLLGQPLLALLAAHSVLYGTAPGWCSRLAGPLWALGVSLGAFLSWCLAQWAEFGAVFTVDLERNLLLRWQRELGSELRRM